MPKPKSGKDKILIIGPSWVGDMVMAQSLFITIKQQRPNAIIDVLAPAWSRPLLERMPEVSHAIDMPIGHGKFALGERQQIGKALCKEQYSEAIVLPNSWKSALIPWFADIPTRTGWLGEARYVLLNEPRKLDKKKYPLMVQRFNALAFPSGTPAIPIDECPAPILKVDATKQQLALKKANLTLDKPVLVLCPGAEFGPAKQWPAEHYAEVANELLKKDWQVWIMGSEADKAIAEDIYSNTGLQNTELQNNVSNLCGKTTLEEAIDLMSLANQVVSNDSGLMHIASALNRPLSALYGATSPEFTPPLSGSANIVSTNIDCAPCFKRECPLGHHKCMKELKPKTVLENISRA